MNTLHENFTATVAAHQDRVYALALGMLRDRDDAADVAQEAFVRLWRKGDRVPGERLAPWLYRVTHNLCLDHLRRRNLALKRLGQPDPEAVERLSVPADDPAGDPLPAPLAAALDRLPARTRSLVILHYCQDMKLAEIAELLGMSLPAVKTALHRARKVLREALQSGAAVAGQTLETGT